MPLRHKILTNRLLNEKYYIHLFSCNVVADMPVMLAFGLYRVDACLLMLLDLIVIDFLACGFLGCLSGIV